MSKELLDQVRRRRTFAIISHPDAGKTTLTEKLLLFSGAIQSAGTVKGKKTGKFATSDWMEIEKQRGIFRGIKRDAVRLTKTTPSTSWTRRDTKTSPRTPTAF